ncbi:serine hydrolase [Shinella pollutisoli]|uniref:Serine hydrolase n=1 Tax=Shinella pollutisoli TaxID=2250594 RepID=A0ABV7DMV6_9HYPH|nr:serine hydrolase [Shinella pollutisoli]
MTVKICNSLPSVQFPTDSEVRRILVQRIDEQKQAVGIVVGMVSPKGRRVVSHGSLGVMDPRPVNGETVFEIGSVTKTFTALLLAEMSIRGEIGLDDPVAHYLPKGVTVPERADKAITLADLATHFSGLPRLPDNMPFGDRSNPYADYTLDLLYDFLSNHQPRRDTGASWEYSNLGYGLLGHVLALRAGCDYETLVRDRILVPLGMTNTAVTLSTDMRSRLAIGHSASLEAVPNWDLPTLAGAGALRSTVNDMLTYLEMALGILDTPLRDALNGQLATRRPIGTDDNSMALGWPIARNGDTEFVRHGGGTGGYRSFVGFVPQSRIGVVVLSNTSADLGVDDIAMHLLNPEVPLAIPPKQRVAIEVDPNLYHRYVGRYRLADDFILNVSQEDSRLFVQASGQDRVELFPESKREFFCKNVNAQISFEESGQSHAERLTLHQGGRDRTAFRLDT